MNPLAGVLLVALLLFGGKRIPEVARSIGTGMRDFRRAMREVQREVDIEGMMRTPPENAGGTGVGARRLPATAAACRVGRGRLEVDGRGRPDIKGQMVGSGYGGSWNGTC